MKRVFGWFSIFLLGVCAALGLFTGLSAAGFAVGWDSFEERFLYALSSRFPVVRTPFGAVELKTVRKTHGLDIYAKCSPCTLNEKLLSPQSLKLDSVELKGDYYEHNFSGTLLVSDRLKLEVSSHWKPFSANAVFKLPPTKIAEVYSLLDKIVPEVERAQIEGTVMGKGKIRLPQFRFSFDPQVTGFKVSGLIPEGTYKSGKFKYFVKDRNRRRIARISGEETQDWLSLTDIGPMALYAVIASEDIGFYSHGGFDLSSIQEATQDNEKSGRIKRGGSTLTQQLAKNLFLNGERTYARKLRELLYAVELEADLGKRRILELYLNIVEWGPEIYGIKRAAMSYFDKQPSELLPEEAAWLASILRNPISAWTHQYLSNTPRMWRVRLALRRMKNLTPDERQSAESRRIEFSPRLRLMQK